MKVETSGTNGDCFSRYERRRGNRSISNQQVRLESTASQVNALGVCLICFIFLKNEETRKVVVQKVTSTIVIRVIVVETELKRLEGSFVVEEDWSCFQFSKTWSVE